MLTDLATIKARLALDPFDTTYDLLLLRAIVAVSARLNCETNRSLARTENASYEFPAGDTDIQVPCYPIESVSKFELKRSESEGWVEQRDIDFLVARHCVIVLPLPLSAATSTRAIARVTYTGGYLVPGSPDLPGATRLPAELEHAAVEQTAYWFQAREKIGLKRQWPQGGSYEEFADPDLLPSVRAVLARYTRLVL
jgi:hypothetical protein